MPTITIIGGGSSAHTLIPLLTDKKNKINLISSKPEQWSKEVTMNLCSSDGKIHRSIAGNIDICTSAYEELIPESDIIVLCMPVSEYQSALNKISNHLPEKKQAFIGTLYGQGGFNWMVEKAFSKKQKSHVTTFAIGLLPWICRTDEYGRVGINYGAKKRNVVAISNKSKFDELHEKLLRKISLDFFGTGEFYLADNFLSLTLSVDNQIIHPSRCYGLFKSHGGTWRSREEIPLFYKDFDDFSASILQSIDDEYSSIRTSIMSSYPAHKFSYMLSYLELERFSYGSANTDIKTSFTDSKTLAAITPPTVLQGDQFILDSSHRFFNDDIEYGLKIAQWFSKKLNLTTPTIDKIIEWADKIRDTNSSSSKKTPLGTPDSYNIKSLADALDLYQ